MASTNRQIIWRALRLTLLSVVAVVGAGLLAGCGGSGGSSTSASNPSPPKPAAKVVHVKVVGHEQGEIGPDGKGHDTFLPSNFNVKAGLPAKVVVTNYDEMAHSITAPDLGINQTIAAAKDKSTPSKTTFTLVVNKAGKFRWYCDLPCDDWAGGWAMTADKDGPSRDGFMAGFITAS